MFFEGKRLDYETLWNIQGSAFCVILWKTFKGYDVEIKSNISDNILVNEFDSEVDAKKYFESVLKETRRMEYKFDYNPKDPISKLEKELENKKLL